jgi:hypothetical protein
MVCHRGQSAHRIATQPGIGRKPNVGLDHRRIDPHRPRAQASLAVRPDDQRPDQIVDDL